MIEDRDDRDRGEATFKILWEICLNPLGQLAMHEGC